MADDKPEIAAGDDLGFDPEALKAKYLAERDRREAWMARRCSRPVESMR